MQCSNYLERLLRIDQVIANVIQYNLIPQCLRFRIVLFLCTLMHSNELDLKIIFITYCLLIFILCHQLICNYEYIFEIYIYIYYEYILKYIFFYLKNSN